MQALRAAPSASAASAPRARYCPAENGEVPGALPADDARAAFRSLGCRCRLFQGDETDGRLGFLLDPRFAGRVSAPARLDEPAGIVEKLLELVIISDAEGVAGAERQGALEERFLDVVQERAQPRPRLRHGKEDLLTGVAARRHALALLHVSRADFHAQRDPLQLVLGELPARGRLVVLVEEDTEAGFQLIAELPGERKHGILCLVLEYGNNDDLGRGQPGRQDQSLVIGVGHDDGANEARGDSPGGGPDMVQGLLPGLEGDLERLGEVLTEVVRRSRLQGFCVLHQGLDAVRAHGACEFFRI